MISKAEFINATEFTVRDAPALSPGARVYRLACPHGVSSAALVPGRKPLADVAVFDLVVPGHHRRHGCECLPDLPNGLPVGTPA